MGAKFLIAVGLMLVCAILTSCSKSESAANRPGKVVYWSANGGNVHFDGKDSAITIPKTSSQDVGRQVTIQFWMKADSDNPLENYQGLVTSDFFHIEVSDGINFAISTDNGASFAETKYANGGRGPMVASGEWHHIAGTYDGKKLQLYVDGKPSGKPKAHKGVISPMLPDSYVSIGSEDGRTSCSSCIGTRYFKGIINKAAVFNRAMSADEIAAIYRSDRP